MKTEVRYMVTCAGTGGVLAQRQLVSNKEKLTEEVFVGMQKYLAEEFGQPMVITAIFRLDEDRIGDERNWERTEKLLRKDMMEMSELVADLTKRNEIYVKALTYYIEGDDPDVAEKAFKDAIDYKKGSFQ